MRNRIACGFVALSAFAALAGCAAAPFDYGPYLAHMPRSILVLPPTNDTVEVLAPYSCLSTVTHPLAERGYYVFPVAVVDEYMRQNGLPTPAEMNAVPVDKLREVFGADAVLYLHITDWGTKYVVIQSVTTVKVTGRLVDSATGQTIWTGEWIAQQGSGDSGGGLIGMVATALVTQVVRTTGDAAHTVAMQTAPLWIEAEDRGFLVGPYHPDHAADQARRRAPAEAKP
jgi:hypothetical protein